MEIPEKPKVVDHRRVRVNITFEAILFEDDTNETLQKELEGGIEDFFAGDVSDLKVTVESL